MKRFYTLIVLAMTAIMPALAQWNTGATPVCIFDAAGKGDYYGANPKAVRTPDKKTWLAWKVWDVKYLGDVKCLAVRTFVQLLDRNGVPQFDEPIMVNDHITQSSWSDFGLQVAADGSVIVTVADGRLEEEGILATGTSEAQRAEGYCPAIYKIDQDGNFLWGIDGVDIPEFSEAAFTNCYVVGDDTWFITYNVYYGDPSDNIDHSIYGLFIQRINDDGTTLWEKPLKVSEDFSFQPQIVPITDGDFFYFDETPNGARVQRMNRNFEPVWAEPVIYDEYKYEGYEMNPYRIVADGKGGAVVTFVRNMGQFAHNIRVQHINGDGSLGFGLTGLDAANTLDNDYDYPGVSVNPETEEILIDFESQLERSYDVMLQKFSYDGDYLFDELGISIASKSLDNAYSFARVGSGALKGGDWIVAYRDVQAYGANVSFIIRRYDKDGNRVWTRTIGRNLDPSSITFIVEDDGSYLFYREQGSRNTGINIFRINHDGTYDFDSPDGIEAVTESAVASARQYFDLNGRRLQQPQRGLNLVRKTDGTVQKQIR